VAAEPPGAGPPSAEPAVRESGDRGPAVVWVHGYTMDSSVWDELWSLLPGWHHVGVDLPGHGRSRPLAPGERMRDLGRQVAGVCARHGARHLVGLSFGSTVALQAAIEAPGALSSLVLGAPAVAGAGTDPAAEVRYAQLAQLYARFGPGPHMTTLWMSSPPDIFRGLRQHPRRWERLRTVIDRHRWQELTDGAMRSLAEHVQSPAELARIEAGTLVLLGAADMPAFRRSAAVVSRCVARCRAVEVAGAGHLCLLERPEVVAPVIAGHLRAAEALTPPPS
jgi:pimeloyl-ACP methyl ester carboxylesterase